MESAEFAAYMRRARARGRLVVQPRMGFSSPAHMRRGLLAVKAARAPVAGTVTLDSYTRTGQFAEAARVMADAIPLNGYPIVTHGVEVTREVIEGVRDEAMPIQVRHGSSLPMRIFQTIVDCGIDATEGGPVSYCLPYNRTPLRKSVREWTRCVELFASARAEVDEPHLESFGGCMLGQLCPPSLLIAITVLEGMFFAQHGMRSVSLSYAQQTNPEQDAEALTALNRIAADHLPTVDRHVVVYTYMGVYPNSREGALDLLGDAASLAVRGGAARLIVKTPAEAHRIPTIEENVEALEFAAAVADHVAEAGEVPQAEDTGLYAEAVGLVERVLELSEDIGTALIRAFEAGFLDVPYCLHPDNRGASSTYLDGAGRLRWGRTGSMPMPAGTALGNPPELGSSDLLDALSFVARRYDRAPSLS